MAAVHHLPAPLLRPPARPDPRELRQVVAIRYVKVAEYQARGVVHFHAIIRLDAPGETASHPAPVHRPLLCDAIGQAAKAAVIITDPAPGTPPVTLRFGAQTDARPVRHGTELPGTGPRCPSRPSRTTSLSTPPRLSTRPACPTGRSARPGHRESALLPPLQADDHHRLAARRQRDRTGQHPVVQVGPHARLRRSLPHQIPPLLGHLRPLRRARTEHRKRQRHPDGERDPWGRPLDDTVVLVLSTWTYDGTGYTATPSAELALASAARARAH